MTVRNYVGQTVYTGAGAFNGGKGQLNLSEQVPGIYILELKGDKGNSEIFRVVIEQLIV